MDALIRSVWEQHERRALAKTLLRFDDHLLADIGIRRDQIGLDGVRPFDRAPPRSPSPRRGVAKAPARATLQGCG